MRDNDLYNMFSKITPDNSLREKITKRIEVKSLKQISRRQPRNKGHSK